MAANTRSSKLGKASIITTNEENQLKTTPATLHRVIVWDVGTTATLDVYDDDATTNNKLFGWVTADGRGVFEIGIRTQDGLRVVTGGTFGGAVVVWD